MTSSCTVPLIWTGVSIPALEFFGSRQGSGHSGTYSHANGGEFANIAVAWLRWQLKGDKDSAKEFTGAACSLCKDPNWTVVRKGL